MDAYRKRPRHCPWPDDVTPAKAGGVLAGLLAHHPCPLRLPSIPFDNPEFIRGWVTCQWQQQEASAVHSCGNSSRFTRDSLFIPTEVGNHYAGPNV